MSEAERAVGMRPEFPDPTRRIEAATPVWRSSNRLVGGRKNRPMSLETPLTPGKYVPPWGSNSHLRRIEIGWFPASVVNAM